MNSIISRDSDEMKRYSKASNVIAGDIEEVCSRLKRLLDDSRGFMQDESGQRAISYLENMVSDIGYYNNSVYAMSDRVRKSAELIEEADDLL